MINSFILDIPERLERYKQFYNNKRGSQILLVIEYNEEGWQPGTAYKNTALNSFDFTSIEEHKKFWDICIANTLYDIQNHDGIDDDWIPGVEPFYGFGSFGAVFCDANLTFKKDTSYMDHVLMSLDDIKNLNLKKDRFWRDMFINAGEYISQKADGRFMVNPYPNPGPLDILNLLRGNELFTDMYIEKDKVHTILSLCTDAIIDNIKKITRGINNPCEGCFAFNRWFPKGVLLLEDTGDLCSPEMYNEFGAPYTQKVIDTVGGAYIHHHSLGRHQYGNIAALKGLYAQQISSDQNAKRPVTELEYVFSQTGQLPIDIECTPQEIYDNIDALKKGRVILYVDTSCKKEALNLVHFVRSHTMI